MNKVCLLPSSKLLHFVAMQIYTKYWMKLLCFLGKKIGWNEYLILWAKRTRTEKSHNFDTDGKNFAKQVFRKSLAMKMNLILLKFGILVRRFSYWQRIHGFWHTKLDQYIRKGWFDERTARRTAIRTLNIFLLFEIFLLLHRHSIMNGIEPEPKKNKWNFHSNMKRLFIL